MSIIPKQALQTAVDAIIPQVDEFLDKAQTLINQRISVQGNTINNNIGTEEDGFVSLTATTSKGDANEGPAISLMTKNIKKGSENIITKVSSTSKLESVTGKKAKSEVVLNETIIQACPNGGIQALREIAKVPDKEIPDCFDKSSPIPSQVKESVDVDVNQGGIENKVAKDMRSAVLAVSQSINSPFGSNNQNASAGSSFGNIFGQLITIVQNLKTKYESPNNAIKISPATTILNEKNQPVATPNATNNNGTTNLKNIVTKSNTEDINPEVEDTILPYEVGVGLRNYDINTFTTEEGGTFKFPVIGHESHLTAEFKACNREITHLIVSFSKRVDKKQYTPEQLQRPLREGRIKAFGLSAVNAEPKKYGFPTHFYISKFGATHVTRDTNILSYINGDLNSPFNGAITVMIDAGEDDDPNAVNPLQMMFFGILVDKFLEVFPGAEVLGLSDIRPNIVNNPPIDLRDYTKSRNRKASTFLQRVIDQIPSAAELADRQPANIPLPKKPSLYNIPNVAQTAREQNKIATTKSVTFQNYVKSQEQALDLIRQKNNLIVDADKTFGSGQLGNLLGKVNGLDGVVKTLLDAAQELKQGELKDGKAFDKITGVFK